MDNRFAGIDVSKRPSAQKQTAPKTNRFEGRDLSQRPSAQKNKKPTFEEFKAMELKKAAEQKTSRKIPNEIVASQLGLLGRLQKFENDVIKPTMGAVGGFLGTKTLGEQVAHGGMALAGSERGKENFSTKKLVGGALSTASNFLAVGAAAKGAKGLLKVKPYAQGALAGGMAAGGGSLEKGEDLKEAAEKAKTGATIGAALPIAGKLIGSADKPIRGLIKRKQAKKIAKNSAKVEEFIAPEQTKKEVGRALKRGLLKTGRNKGRIGGVEEGTIELSDDLKLARDLIAKDVNKADLQDFSQTFKKIGEMISKKDEKLIPELQKVALSQKYKGSLLSGMDDLFARQAQDVNFDLNPAGYTRLQKNFRKVVEDLTNKKQVTLDDIRQARIAYDKSVKSTVKEASSEIGSSDSLILQKEMWLQNRNYLNQILKESTGEVGGVVSKEFKEMSALIRAQENMVPKAKEYLKGEPGMLRKFLEENSKVIIGGSLIGGVGAGTWFGLR